MAEQFKAGKDKLRYIPVFDAALKELAQFKGLSFAL